MPRAVPCWRLAALLNRDAVAAGCLVKGQPWTRCALAAGPRPGLGSTRKGRALVGVRASSAVGAIPLGLWLAASLVALASPIRAAVLAWLHGPGAAILAHPAC